MTNFRIKEVRLLRKCWKLSLALVNMRIYRILTRWTFTIGKKWKWRIREDVKHAAIKVWPSVVRSARRGIISPVWYHRWENHPLSHGLVIRADIFQQKEVSFRAHFWNVKFTLIGRLIPNTCSNEILTCFFSTLLIFLSNHISVWNVFYSFHNLDEYISYANELDPSCGEPLRASRRKTSKAANEKICRFVKQLRRPNSSDDDQYGLFVNLSTTSGFSFLYLFRRIWYSLF